MVTEWLMSVFTSVTTWLLGLVEVPDPPSFLADAPGWFTTVGTYVTGTGIWIPWGLLAAVITAWVLAMGAMVAIKGIRIVASFITLGGGSAA